MAKNRQPLVYQEEHTYYCILEDNEGNQYVGKATCCPKDYEYESEKVGFTIAHMRAAIKLAKATIKALRHEKRGLHQLYYSMNRSKHFDPKSYEAKMLYRQLRIKDDDIEAIKEVIIGIEERVKEFIAEKEKFHQSIKKVRENKKADDK